MKPNEESRASTVAPDRTNPRKKLVVMTAAIAVAAAVAISTAFVLGRRSGAIDVTVMDSRAQGPSRLWDSNFTVYIDGELKASGILSEGQFLKLTIGMSWFFDSCHAFAVVGNSWGAGSAGIRDVATVSLCDGAVEEAFLQI